MEKNYISPQDGGVDTNEEKENVRSPLSGLH